MDTISIVLQLIHTADLIVPIYLPLIAIWIIVLLSTQMVIIAQTAPNANQDTALILPIHALYSLMGLSVTRTTHADLDLVSTINVLHLAIVISNAQIPLLILPPTKPYIVAPHAVYIHKLAKTISVLIFFHLILLVIVAACARVDSAILLIPVPIIHLTHLTLLILQILLFRQVSALSYQLDNIAVSTLIAKVIIVPLQFFFRQQYVLQLILHAYPIGNVPHKEKIVQAIVQTYLFVTTTIVYHYSQTFNHVMMLLNVNHLTVNKHTQM
jgi:hypothetical protein